MRDKVKTIAELDSFIKSDSKHCLILGTDIQNKHWNVLRYLNRLSKNLRILIRIDSMTECEYILKYKAKTGSPKKIKKLSIYVDSMQSKSQQSTPRKFNCILIYPIAGLKGIKDKNIDDILNHMYSQKVFWISNHDNTNYSYLKEICNIKHTILMNNDDEVIHNRILSNYKGLDNREEFKKAYVDNLSYYRVEDAIDSIFNMGGISTSSMGQELILGSFGKYTFGGNKKSKTFFIKVKENMENGKYVLLIKDE
ncbi:hypothetical protein [Clostridium sp. UBA7791]|uniref:hypothetical protein n=1 Tax=Clostridium sp. UBA7791 TaxID=1946379 RepID=UPI0032173FF8